MIRNFYTQRYACITSMFMCLFMLTFSGSAAQGTGEKKNSFIINKAAMAKLQLRYATIEVPEGLRVKTAFKYTITDNDEGIYIYTHIKKFDDDIQEFLDKEIVELQKHNTIPGRKKTNITAIKETREVIDGQKALIVRIEYERYSSDLIEYVFIMHKTGCIMWKAWHRSKFFLRKEHIWQAMYRSFHFDNSKPYKLPFGSFILHKEVRDSTYFYFTIPDENDYQIEISYTSEENANKKIKNFKSTVLSVLLGAWIRVMRNKKLMVDGREGRYFEARITRQNGETIVMAFFHITDGLNPGLEFEMRTDNIAT